MTIAFRLIRSLSACAFCLYVANSQAQALLESISPQNVAVAPATSRTLGYAFSVSEALNVTSLGYYDVGANGLLGSHDVGLWDSTGVLLAQVEVTPDSTAVDGFAYTALTAPVLLTAGDVYYLGGTIANDQYVQTVSAYVANPTVSIVSSAQQNVSTTLAWPDVTIPAAARQSYFNVNLQVAAVPEPSTALMMLGGLGAVFARRKMSRAKVIENS